MVESKIVKVAISFATWQFFLISIVSHNTIRPTRGYKIFGQNLEVIVERNNFRVHKNWDSII